MSDENFFARWSRRKAEAAKAASEKRDAETVPPQETNDATAAALPEKSPRALTPASTPATAAEVPSIDVKDLPPIDSIGPGTDVSVFLRPGVPAELARAALRRAWSTDPAIRDYIGLSENSWDFTAPDGIPGFAPLSAEEAQRLLVAFMGQGQKPSADAPISQDQNPASRDEPQSHELQSQEPSGESAVGPTRNQIAAADAAEAVKASREHFTTAQPLDAPLGSEDAPTAAQHVHFDVSYFSRKLFLRRGGKALPK